jgi:hypothetical protein
MRALDADVPVYELRPFQQAIDEDLSSSHILGSLFASFALLALVLAASGLYAVVSYASAQRVKEFGVRIALGATGRDIVTMMLRQTAKLVAIWCRARPGRRPSAGDCRNNAPVSRVRIRSRDLRRRGRDTCGGRHAGHLRSGAPRHVHRTPSARCDWSRIMRYVRVAGVLWDQPWVRARALRALPVGSGLRRR